jgi:hypothetical protein
MARRLLGTLPVALGLLFAACADQNDSGPVAPGQPDFAKTAPLACNSSVFPSLINTYFTDAPTRQQAQTAVNTMTANPYGAVAQANGFDVMALIETAVNNGNTAATTGSTLTKELIKCMYDAASTTSDFPSNFADLDFTASLDPTVPGAYAVRGPQSSNTPVASRKTVAVTGRLSGVAPPQDPTDLTVPGSALPWSQILSERALIYGIPVASSTGVGGYSINEYQWEAIRPSVPFGDGGATVALCLPNSTSNSMVNESNFGVLAYIGADYICDGTYASVPQGWGARVLVQRLLKLVIPQPLFAGLSTIGGSAGGLKSKFSNKPVPSITFAFDTAPPSTMLVSKMPYRVVVRATTSDGAGVNGVCVYMHGSNNNGQNTELLASTDCANTAPGDVSAITKSKAVTTQTGQVVIQPGYAAFSLKVSKTGGLILNVSSTDGTGISGVVGRDGQTFNTLKLKTNVKP